MKTTTWRTHQLPLVNLVPYQLNIMAKIEMVKTGVAYVCFSLMLELPVMCILQIFQ